jgi:hypothetical protein
MSQNQSNETPGAADLAKALADRFQPFTHGGLTMDGKGAQTIVTMLRTIQALARETEDDRDILERRLLLIREGKKPPVIDGRTGRVVPFPKRPPRFSAHPGSDGPDGGDAA